MLDIATCSQDELNMPLQQSSSKIYPAAEQRRAAAYTEDHQPPPPHIAATSAEAADLTVWKRSSISFQGTDGFMVFDNSNGRLVFRVDNYRRRRTARLSSSVVVGGGGGGGCRAQVHYSKEHNSGLVLMDGFGKALITLTPQLHMPSMQYQWIGYRGGEDDQRNRKAPLFMMRTSSQPSSSSFLSLRSMTPQTTCEAEVFIGDYRRSIIKSGQRPDYRIEGSFRRRNCKITGADGQTLASISRKLAKANVLLSDDVFSLVVERGIEADLVMAFIVVIDRLCPKQSYTPILCS